MRAIAPKRLDFASTLLENGVPMQSRLIEPRRNANMLAVVLGISVLISFGCSSEEIVTESASENPAKPAAVASDPAVKAAPRPGKTPKYFNLRETIAKQREELRNVPGRTGILAEKKRYSLFDEELIIRDFFQDRRSGFFVDVGCAWPVMANNTAYLEKHLGWNGFAIDALEEYAEQWQRARPASKFFAYLVADKSSDDSVFYRSENVGLSSATRERADGVHFGGALNVEEISIPSISLNDLLDREGITKVDLLAMDIEGHELTALHGFDIERFRPDLVVTEGRRPDVAAYFAEHGYGAIKRYLAFDTVNVYYAPVEVAAE